MAFGRLRSSITHRSCCVTGSFTSATVGDMPTMRGLVVLFEPEEAAGSPLGTWILSPSLVDVDESVGEGPRERGVDIRPSRISAVERSSSFCVRLRRCGRERERRGGGGERR